MHAALDGTFKYLVQEPVTRLEQAPAQLNRQVLRVGSAMWRKVFVFGKDH